jgi:hypothetical protein
LTIVLRPADEQSTEPAVKSILGWKRVRIRIRVEVEVERESESETGSCKGKFETFQASLRLS